MWLGGMPALPHPDQGKSMKHHRASAGGRRPRAGQLFPRSMNLFYLPAAALFGVFILLPFIQGAQYSLTDWNGYSGASNFIGVQNYVRLFGDPTFRTALVNTLIYGIVSTVLQQAAGLGLALLVARNARVSSLARAVLYLPAIIAPVVMGSIYYLVFQYSNGALNDVVLLFGGERQVWLGDPATAIVIIVLVNTIQFVGISMLIYVAGLQSVPEELLEAARLDGASRPQVFRHVTVPLLQPAFATSITLNLIGGLKIYDVIEVMTGGGPGVATESVSTLISRTYFANQNAGYSAAMGIVLFAVIAIFTVVLNRGFRRKEVHL
jgi:raffinose/stachyose/melibiose transport system permease protein